MFDHDDIDVARTDAELMGLPNIDEGDIDIVELVAGGELDEPDEFIESDEGHEHDEESAPGEDTPSAEADEPSVFNDIPAYRVAEVMQKIGSLAKDAGVAVPELPDAQALPKAEFDRLIAVRDRLRIQADITEMERSVRTHESHEPKAAEVRQADEREVIRALRAEYKEALFDGDDARMAELEDKIDEAMLRKARDEARSEMQQIQSQSEAQALLVRVADAVVERYPFLGGEGKDEEAFAAVMDERNALIARGEKPYMALAMAADTWGSRYARFYDQPSKPKPRITDERSKRAVARNVDEIARQPERMDSSLGNRAEPPKPRAPKTLEDYESMSEKDRAVLLGMG